MELPDYPKCPRQPIVDDYHGRLVPDPYRWLEEYDTRQTRCWIEEQQSLSSDYLDRLPKLDQWIQSVERLAVNGTASSTKTGGERKFRISRPDGTGGWEAQVQDHEDGPWLPIGAPFPSDMSIMRWQPSPTGDHLAIQVVVAGDERQTPLSVIDVATGQVEDDIRQTRYSPIEWRADGRSFFYVRSHLDRPGRGVYQHVVGADPAGDELVIGDEGPVTRYNVRLSHERWLILTLREGTSPETHVLIADTESDEPARELPLDGASSASVLIDEDGRLFATVSAAAGFGQVLVAEPERGGWGPWRVLIPEDTSAVLSTVALTRTRAGKRLVALRVRDGVSRMTVHDGENGEALEDVELPGAGNVLGITTEPAPGTLTFVYTDWVIPASVWHLDVDSGQVTPADSQDTPHVDIKILHRTYRSHDGVEIPLTILAPPDGESGPRATILTAYGGFGLSYRPRYQPDLLAWVLAGGVSAVAGIRGGDERGRRWHRDGCRTKKPNSFADLQAGADWLVENGWTSPEQLALFGGSNGGLLAAGTAVRRPQTFAAAVISAAPLDMIRYERWGLGKAWRREYGSPEDPADLDALLSYSPYHNVSAPFSHTATLLITGDNDSRVDPLHSRKMTAQLQQATVDAPVLHHLIDGAGHTGVAGDEGIRVAGKILAFIAHHTGLVPADVT